MSPPERADVRAGSVAPLRPTASTPLRYLLVPLVILLTVSASCASGMKNQPDTPGTSTHQPQKPADGARIQISPVYIDEVAYAPGPPRPYLRISGHLPTPCHQLAMPEFETDGDTLNITLASWQLSDVMCAQVLEPFVYYLVPESYDVSVPAGIRVNGETVER